MQVRVQSDESGEMVGFGSAGAANGGIPPAPARQPLVEAEAFPKAARDTQILHFGERILHSATYGRSSLP
jgi:hypothetical protein